MIFEHQNQWTDHALVSNPVTLELLQVEEESLHLLQPR